MMKADYRVEKIYSELLPTVSHNHTIDAWKYAYWDALSQYLRERNEPGCGITVGGPRERVVFDEGNFGVNAGISKGPQQPHGQRNEKRIARKMPAQTIWKRNATPKQRQWIRKFIRTSRGGKTVVTRKKPAGCAPMKGVKAGTRRDKRTKGSLWVFCAVEVGSVREGRKTHGAGTKRSVFSMLPDSTKAEDGKPRGWKSLKKVIKTHIKRKSHLVKDGWRGSTTAVEMCRDMGYKWLPPVIHQKHFRDPKTGLHTNDAESEINRVKQWMRKKYHRLCSRARTVRDGNGDEEVETSPHTLQCKLDEFMFLKNVGNEMSTIMRALQCQNGIKHRFRDI
jgi:hypothetical protein